MCAMFQPCTSTSTRMGSIMNHIVHKHPNPFKRFIGNVADRIGSKFMNVAIKWADSIEFDADFWEDDEC